LSGPRPPVLPPPPPSPAAVPVVVCISHGPRRGAVWCGGGSEASRFVRVLKLSPPSPRRRRVQVLQRKACGRGRNYGQSIRFHTSASTFITTISYKFTTPTCTLPPSKLRSLFPFCKKYIC
jgi:hypothetical protein